MVGIGVIHGVADGFDAWLMVQEMPAVIMIVSAIKRE
jgi:hypothetical protein